VRKHEDTSPYHAVTDPALLTVATQSTRENADLQRQMLTIGTSSGVYDARKSGIRQGAASAAGELALAGREIAGGGRGAVGVYDPGKAIFTAVRCELVITAVVDQRRIRVYCLQAVAGTGSSLAALSTCSGPRVRNRGWKT